MKVNSVDCAGCLRIVGIFLFNKSLYIGAKIMLAVLLVVEVQSVQYHVGTIVFRHSSLDWEIIPPLQVAPGAGEISIAIATT